eukprot:GEMP01044692.1.p1 GENE.GEMP01044692.1~~GEMP01044692.1.p1  ORF type:complete len:201 (+),score=52.97 GEMP01044692.1:118-720(+)
MWRRWNANKLVQRRPQNLRSHRRQLRIDNQTAASPATAGTYPCGGDRALREWVNVADVKQALHVSEDAFFFMADNGLGFQYNFTVPDTTELMKALAESGKRVLIYDGDTDPALNSFHAQNWTVGLQFEVKQKWRPWTLDGKQKVAGHVVRYGHNFDFATIRGAGHMVPTYKPDAAFLMISSWLKNEEYPRYIALDEEIVA